MTEDEASKKTCWRTFGSPCHVDEWGNIQGGNQFCIASACMAWRWSAAKEIDNKPTLQAQGYCGVAGKPEK